MKKVALSSAFIAIGGAGLVFAGPIASDVSERSAPPLKETVVAANSKDVTIGSGKSIGSNRDNKDNGSGNVVIRGGDDSQGDCKGGTAGREGRVTRGKGNVIGDSKSSGQNSGKVTIRGGNAGKPGRCDDGDPGTDDPENGDSEDNGEDDSPAK